MSKVLLQPDKSSFIIENALTKESCSIAGDIIGSLVLHDLNSENGIRLSLDKPLGCNHYLSNLERPAVLRQYFGRTLPNKTRYSYGNGTGSKTVGTHPNHLVTRDMTPNMMTIAGDIYKILNDNSTNTSMCIERPNHCTVLFYYHKAFNITNKMLGYHTDNVYSKGGKFLHAKNSQTENTPTCVLTIGDPRNLSFQKQKNTRFDLTKRMRWKECRKDILKLEHNSLFILHPSDERPHMSRGEIFRWRHGVPEFNGINKLSVALVFRHVQNTIDISNKDVVSMKNWKSGSQISCRIIDEAKMSYRRLVSIFFRVYKERYEY